MGNKKIMIKRIAKLAIELNEIKFKMFVLERNFKHVVEENDRLITELLKFKEVK